MTATVLSDSKADDVVTVWRRHASSLIDNLDTRLDVLRLGPAQVPISFNDRGAQGTCYLCCPSVAYVDYARAEFRHFRRYRALLPALDLLVRLGRPLIALAKLDHQMQPNNWLLATNLLPPLSKDIIEATTTALVTADPGRVIVWRSINDHADAAILRDFRAAGYRLLPARQIYLFDCRSIPPRRSRDETRDARLLSAAGLHVVAGADFTPADFVQAEHLYALLYLDKYTPLNPHYTALFMQEMARTGVLSFHGLRGPGGMLDGVIAFFEQGQAMTAPIVGYDTTKPQALGLYRALTALAMRHARAGRLLLNMSAGAASFKRNRSGVAAVEYTAIYVAHLPVRHRAAAWLVQIVLERIGLPLLQRFEL